MGYPRNQGLPPTGGGWPPPPGGNPQPPYGPEEDPPESGQSPYGAQHGGQQAPYGPQQPHGGQPPYGPPGPPPGSPQPYGPEPPQGEPPYGPPGPYGPAGPYGPPGPYGPQQPSGRPYGPPPQGQPYRGQPPPGAVPPGWPPAGQGPGGPGVPGGPGGFGPQYEPPRRNNLPLIIGAIVAVFVLLGGGGGALFLALGNNEESPGPSPNPTTRVAAPTTSAPPSTPDPDPTLTGDPLTRLNSRAGDPQPLTLDELFANRKFDVGKRTYTRAARKENKNCAAAVKGPDLRAALRAGDCTQVLRASYVSRSGNIISTVGIANLKDADAVQKAFDAARDKDSFIAPLRGSGPARKLGVGNALGAQLSRGHYLVLSWVQYADGHKPSSTEDKKLTRHDEDVFEETILSALSYRMLTGKPLTP